jgi:uncharacterized protein (DUF2236 family)
VVVDRAQLEASLTRLTAEVADANAGIHGPGSASWQLERDAVIFLGGGRAALLQLAHPFVAYSIAEHSRTKDDVVGRFQRTFDNVFAMSFGPLDHALRSARRVHAIHTRIHGVLGEDAGAFVRGSGYHANDPDALRWVWATLVDSVIAVYDAIGEPVPMTLRDDYYRGSRRFARLFGISDDAIPATWADFARYVARTVASSTITVTAPARHIAGFLFAGRLGGATQLVTAAMLPALVRDQFGLRYRDRERAAFAAIIASVRAMRIVTPRAAWDLPAYRNAVRRLDGLAPSGWSQWLERRLFALVGTSAGRPPVR